VTSRGTSGSSAETPASALVAQLVDVKKYFPVSGGVGRSRRYVHAVDGIDLDIPGAATVGLVGETGSGKSTVARILLRLTTQTAGRVVLNGEDVSALRSRDLRRVRRSIQIVFQDPYSSFDPRSSIRSSIAEALKVHDTLDRRQRDGRISELLQMTGLPAQVMHRYPHELSGGQLQRAALARALAVRPTILVLDEPVSSLDVSTQAQVINLLQDLQKSLGIAQLFISHDLSVVRHVSDYIAVMYLGKIVEVGPAVAVYGSPRHPYTKALLSSEMAVGPRHGDAGPAVVLHGELPSPIHPPSGCRFRTRCPSVMAICSEVEPRPTTTSEGTTVFCHLYGPDQVSPSTAAVNRQPLGPVVTVSLDDSPTPGPIG
jgi:oligopeptide/dipeptide ABC transporter ATP-binding protein